MVIDGRQSNYYVGVTTGQEGAILRALGAYSAVNLDGGGSSCVVVNGEIKNKPSYSFERAVANGIMATVNKENV
nr:phosphodiester glycosidase family protein [uncultured Proteiniphilum sp.]